MAERYGMDLESVKKYLPKDSVADQVKTQKAVDIVRESAVATKPEVKSEDKPEDKDGGRRKEKNPAAKKPAAKKAESGEDKPADKKVAAKKPESGEKKPAARKPAAKKAAKEPEESK